MTKQEFIAVHLKALQDGFCSDSQFASALDSRFNKDQIVLIGKACGLTLGDYARKSKLELCAQISGNNRHSTLATIEGMDLDVTPAPVVRAPSPTPVPVEDIVTCKDWKPTSPVPQVSAQSSLEAAQQLLTIVQQLAGNSVNADTVRSIVQAELSAQPARKLEITWQGVTREVSGHKHPKFDTIVKAVACGLNVMLIGPAGCGKSYLGEQVATALGMPYTANSCSEGMSEAQLSGWFLPTGDNAKFEWHDAMLAHAYECGGLHMIDEIDASAANTLTFINTMAANGHYYLPQRLHAPVIKRHPNFRMIAAGNTYGTGADLVYVGRNALDAATVSRFFKIYLDYDRALEGALVGEKVRGFVNSMRDAIAKFKLRRVAGTRDMLLSQQALDGGIDWSDVRASLLMGWTQDEISKAGI